MRRIGIDANVAILLGFFQGIAKTDNVVDGNNMVRLPKDAQDRTAYSRDQFFYRRGAKMVAAPFLAADGAVEHDRAGDVVPLRRQ